MVPKMNEIEKAKVESLKKFPELILEIKRQRMGCCHRCGGFIPLNHPCLFAMTHNYNDISRLKRFGCPHCGEMNITETTDFRVQRQPIDYSVVDVIEYCINRQKVKKGLFKEEIVETWVKEW